MKFVFLLSSLALASTLSLATAIPHGLDDSTALDLDKRAPEPLPLPLDHGNAEGDLLEKRFGDDGEDEHYVVKRQDSAIQGTPSSSFEPDDSGRGYGVDSSGHRHPGGIPDGWRWYGRQIGWAPYRGWRPPPRWEPPTVFIRIWIRVRWWSPPDYWRSYWHDRWHDDWYRYGVPSHWGWRPKNPRGNGRWYQRNGGWYWRSGGRD
ncbi:hypothetical protein JCM8547_005291 [Rhodosporidiobolus lusitaniae]